MLEWSVIVPSEADVEASAGALERAGASVTRADGDAIATDPWGTIVHVTARTLRDDCTRHGEESAVTLVRVTAASSLRVPAARDRASETAS